MNTATPAIRVEHLTVAYQSKPVLKDVSLTIPRGRLAAVIGPNGAGKSTLLKAILGLIPVLSGEALFLIGDREQSGKHNPAVAYVPQSGSVDWDFPITVKDVALMGRYGRLGWLRRPQKEDRKAAARALEKVGMAKYASRQISQLSGGQQQRVFLARALAQEAEIYLMDEPFRGVDSATEKAIVALLKEMRAQGHTVVVVHHDLETVRDYFDWASLVNVELVANGPLETSFTPCHLNRVFRGTADRFSEEVAW